MPRARRPLSLSPRSIVQCLTAESFVPTGTTALSLIVSSEEVALEAKSAMSDVQKLPRISKTRQWAMQTDLLSSTAIRNANTASVDLDEMVVITMVTTTIWATVMVAVAAITHSITMVVMEAIVTVEEATTQGNVTIASATSAMIMEATTTTTTIMAIGAVVAITTKGAAHLLAISNRATKTLIASRWVSCLSAEE